MKNDEYGRNFLLFCLVFEWENIYWVRMSETLIVVLTAPLVVLDDVYAKRKHQKK